MEKKFYINYSSGCIHWSVKGTYNISAKAKDPYDAEGPWGYLEVEMPKNKAINAPFLKFLQNHPNMFPSLQQLLRLK